MSIGRDIWRTIVERLRPDTATKTKATPELTVADTEQPYDYREGEKYRVVKETEHVLPNLAPPQGAPVSHELDEVTARVRLQNGDVIEYVGTTSARGHDKIRYDCFAYEGEYGEFNPNKWGSADPEYLAPVSEEGMTHD